MVWHETNGKTSNRLFQSCTMVNIAVMPSDQPIYSSQSPNPSQSMPVSVHESYDCEILIAPRPRRVHALSEVDEDRMELLIAREPPSHVPTDIDSSSSYTSSIPEVLGAVEAGWSVVPEEAQQHSQVSSTHLGSAASVARGQAAGKKAPLDDQENTSELAIVLDEASYASEVTLGNFDSPNMETPTMSTYPKKNSVVARALSWQHMDVSSMGSDSGLNVPLTETATAPCMHVRDLDRKEASFYQDSPKQPVKPDSRQNKSLTGAINSLAFPPSPPREVKPPTAPAVVQIRTQERRLGTTFLPAPENKEPVSTLTIKTHKAKTKGLRRFFGRSLAVDTQQTGDHNLENSRDDSSLHPSINTIRGCHASPQSVASKMTSSPSDPPYKGAEFVDQELDDSTSLGRSDNFASTHSLPQYPPSSTQNRVRRQRRPGSVHSNSSAQSKGSLSGSIRSLASRITSRLSSSSSLQVPRTDGRRVSLVDDNWDKDNESWQRRASAQDDLPSDCRNALDKPSKTVPSRNYPPNSSKTSALPGEAQERTLSIRKRGSFSSITSLFSTKRS